MTKTIIHELPHEKSGSICSPKNKRHSYHHVFMMKTSSQKKN